MIKSSYVKLQATASSQLGVFQAIADIAVENGIADNADEVVKGLKDREAQSTTGFQDGFAIPHTQSTSITKPAVVIVRTETGIEWESFDNQPAFFFISLLIPEAEAGTTHLQALSALSRTLMDEEKRQQLLDATTTEQLSLLVEKSITPEEAN
ncbi:PTS fructose transporter subunit IIBC [Oceanobacillus iheyensis]|uniref:Fructose PTS transporter subunit IIA n=2 Tax=Bacillaceae TaxID=186817 RepID=A0AAW5AYZ2_9BACI|nr:PTS fructose transporter subunit IIBC [Oceanobacillus iheyensis]MCG3417741.1 fructose PTS transporter subunit IIA [Oceanobacillus jordanicus]NAO99485.1 PTS sugar transporter subunit IIA [Halomonas sp. MG34]